MKIFMNKGVIGGLLLGLLIPFAVFAAEFRADKAPSFTATEMVSGNLYMAGGSVQSAGTVQGDLVVAGGTIVVSGPVAQDVLAAGGSPTIISSIGGDLRVAGGNVVVQGAVKGDVLAAGGNISLGGTGVGGDVAIAGGSVRIDAPIAGDLKVAGGNVTINAPIHGNVEMHGGKLTLGPKAVISGNLTYTAQEVATLEGGAKVTGATTFTQSTSSMNKAAIATAFFSFWLLARLVMLLIGAYALALIFPRFTRELVMLANASMLPELGIGVVFAIVAPVLSVILIVTLFGLPFGFMGLLAYIALLIFASIAAPIIAGSIVQRLWKHGEYAVDWKTILLGIVVYYLLGFIPFLGWLIKCFFFLVTLGAIISIKWNIIKAWR